MVVVAASLMFPVRFSRETEQVERRVLDNALAAGSHPMMVPAQRTRTDPSQFGETAEPVRRDQGGRNSKAAAALPLVWVTTTVRSIEPQRSLTLRR